MWCHLNSSCYTCVAWVVIAVADRRQRQSLWGHLHTDAGEAGVWLGWAELREHLRAAEGALQRQVPDAGAPQPLQRCDRRPKSQQEVPHPTESCLFHLAGRNWAKIDQLPAAPAPTSASEVRDLEVKGKTTAGLAVCGRSKHTAHRY